MQPQMNDDSKEKKEKELEKLVREAIESAQQQDEILPIKTEVNVNELPKVKSMLLTLDRFLSKKFAFFLLMYVSVMSVCGSLLLASPVIVKAATGSEGNSKLTFETWLYSIMTLVTFLFILAAIYFFARRRARAKNNA